MDYLVVAVLGGLVGTGELIARYRDAPFRALLSWYAMVYVGFNVAASLSALALIRVFGWEFGTTGAGQVRWTQVLVAGFGAMALFRTSLFVVRVGNQDIGVGPAGFLQIILLVADRGVDRQRAEIRANEVPRIMEGLAYAQVSGSLPPLCIALMQNLSPDDQQSIAEEVGALDRSPTPDAAKVLSLGLLLVNYVGADVLRGAVKALRAQLERSPAAGSTSAASSEGPELPAAGPPRPSSAGPPTSSRDINEPQTPLPPIPPGTGTQEAGEKPIEP